MLDYDVSRLEDYTLESIGDLFALMTRCCAIKKVSATERPFDYTSDYIEYGDFDTILKLFRNKYLKDYYSKKETEKRKKGLKSLTNEHLPLASAIAENYNELLKEKQRFIKVEDFSRDYFFDIATRGESEKEKEENMKYVQDIIKSPDFTFNHCIYYNDSMMSAMSLYRRLRLGPKKMTISQLTLLISAIGLPLKLNLSFPKDSVCDRKYASIFQEIPNIQDQLNCYFCLEHLDFSKWVRKIATKKEDASTANRLKRFKQIYRRYMENIMYYNDLAEIAEMIGAKIRISFSAEIIQKYRICQENIRVISHNMKQLSLPDELSTEIESKILESITSDTFDLQIAECLIRLEDERKN